MDILKSLDLVAALYDSESYADDPCKCDESVGHICEFCITRGVLLDAKKEIVRLREKATSMALYAADLRDQLKERPCDT